MRINFKKLSYVLMALVIAMTLVVSMGNVFAKEDIKGEFSKYKLGAKLEKDIQGEPKVNLSNKGKVSLPSVVDHSSDMPPVGDQGQQGSCVGWATSYYKGYQEKKDMFWGNIMFSPSFIYNQIVIGADDGAYSSDAYELMMNLGDCRLSTMPYTASNYTNQPNSTQLNEAKNFKAESWGFLYDTGFNATKTDNLKTYLQTDCCTITIPVTDDFYTGFYDVYNGGGGGHALCVVGYDNSKAAFKFINSWGSAYGYAGYGYITYDLWDSFVDNNLVRSYGMVDADSEPLPTPKYKYTLTFKDARVVEVGSHSAGNQWGVAVKNQSKSTTVMYKRQNNSNPITADKSIQTNYSGCYLGLHEYEENPANDDRASVIISNLHNGDNVIYLTCRDYQYNNYWSKWKFIINRTPN
jgi:hypothetical protein